MGGIKIAARNLGVSISEVLGQGASGQESFDNHSPKRILQISLRSKDGQQRLGRAAWKSCGTGLGCDGKPWFTSRV